MLTFKVTCSLLKQISPIMRQQLSLEGLLNHSNTVALGKPKKQKSLSENMQGMAQKIS